MNTTFCPKYDMKTVMHLFNRKDPDCQREMLITINHETLQQM